MSASLFSSRAVARPTARGALAWAPLVDAALSPQHALALEAAGRVA